MPVILWSTLVLAIALAVVAVAMWRARATLPPLELPPGEHLQATPIQWAVRVALAVGALLGGGAFGVVVWAGPATYQDDDVTRLTVTGLLIASLVALAVPALLSGVWASTGRDRLDERDRAILTVAPTGQAGAMLVVLVAWEIGLTEAYRGAPGIPADFLVLIFWSCALVALAAWNVGVLLGYRRS